MPPSIPLLDLSARFKKYQPDIQRALNDIFSNGKFILGSYLEAFENAMAQRLEVPYAFGCASGTDALVLALRAIGVKPGDEVIVPAFTFVATAEAIVRAGAEPRFVDVDPKYFVIDANHLPTVLSPRTRAIIAVHLFGHCAPMGPIMDYARDHRLHVIEDGAQALPGAWNNQPVGSIGDVACFSFYPSKHLPAAGDGGMVVTRIALIAEALKRLRNHGRGAGFHHEIGMNSRLDEIQAAVLLPQLHDVDHDRLRRQELAQRYSARLKYLPLTTPTSAHDVVHSYMQYTLVYKHRDALQAFLADHGIASAVYYSRPVPAEPAFSAWQGYFSCAEALSQQVLSIPIHAELSNSDQDQIIETIEKFFVTKLKDISP